MNPREQVKPIAVRLAAERFPFDGDDPNVIIALRMAYAAGWDDCRKHERPSYLPTEER
jgi:hypothetical protein